VCPDSAREAGLRPAERQALHPISLEGLRYLRHFQRSDYAEATRAHPEENVKQETETLMQGFFTYLLERELKTPGFLRQIRR
jgi:DNA repair protein RecO (recombination protein O)